MATILITGGTGLIGTHLHNLLNMNGHHVTTLSRTKSNLPNTYFWNLYDNYIDEDAILNTDIIIHLAGENIASKRWTIKRKKQLIESRVKSSEFLFNKVKELNPNLKTFITASGIGYYGTQTSNKIFDENEEPGNDFLSNLCVKWEQISENFKSLKIRTVVFRTGVVLAKTDSALQKISNPIKYGLGATIGKGDQYMPWIHIEDLCNMYLFAIENKNISGIYNAVAPQHISNSELTVALSHKLKRPLWLPKIPSFILKIGLGEMANILLYGSRVSSNKIIETGFQFKFPTIKNALENLLIKD